MSFKICQINATYGLGSTGTIARDINELAIKSGYSVAICSQKSIDKSSYIIGNFFDWKLHALFTRIFGQQSFYSFIATKRLSSYLKREKPDIVHLHNLHSNYINLSLLFKFLSKKNIPVVITLHDCWFFTGKCCHFVDINCDKWKTECNQCPKKHKEINSLFFDRSLHVFYKKKKIYDSIKKLYVVGCSQWITELAKQSPLFVNSKISCIQNGIDVDLFSLLSNSKNSFQSKNKLKNKFVILCFANKIFNLKNISICNNLINNLKKDEIVLIVGCNKKQIDLYKDNAQVICVGNISSKNEMVQIYNASNVFINLTLADTLPTVNMESICCGTPVVTYNTCGSPELVIEGKTGYVIEQFDYKALRNSIDLIKNNTIKKEECATLGKTLFNKNEKYKQYINLYNNILKK